MANRVMPNPQFHRPDGRADFDKARNAVKAALADGPAEEGAERLLDLAAALDTGVARLKRDLLGSALCWNEDNQAVTAWIHQQHRRMVEMGMRSLEALRSGPRQAALRLAAMTLFHWGEALKWIAGRERPDYAPLHALLRDAMDDGQHREPLSWVADGRGHTVTVESLYFRALLLDRYASGNLTRQQVEVLDAWLWEWSGCLCGSDTHPGGAALRADLDANTGLREGPREGPREGDGLSLYLALLPLERRRRELVGELQRGCIVPQHGCTSEFRIEEHIAVLDHLRRAFNSPAGTAARRERQAEAGVRVEVWVGVADILARGAGVRVVSETGRWRALSLGDPSLSVDLSQPGQRVRFESTDPSRRYLWLADTSATGCGFEALDTDAAGIEIGDLIGWRRGAAGHITLARVIRRMPSATAGQLFIGVKRLTDAAIPFTLTRNHAYDRGGADATFLFVPGDDESGRHDAFLTTESDFQQQHAYIARVGDDSFSLRFNRVREKGRGWLLAGFEVMPAKSSLVAPAPDDALPTFELADCDDARTLDPWGSEVSLRLLG